MGKFVTMGAMLQCSFGMTPTSLVVAIPLRPKCMNMLMATVMDMAPGMNIPTFGMCRSMANPTVASATSAAMGVLTPMPCVPVITAPWTPGSTQVKVMNMPALTDNSKCFCAFGGQVSITNPGNAMVDCKG